MFTRILLMPAAAITLLVAGCESADPRDSASSPDATAMKGIPISEKLSEPARDRLVSGRWRSAPGAFPVDRSMWIVLDLSRDRSYVMEARSKGVSSDAIFASSKGTISWTGGGTLKASGDKPGRPMQDLQSWEASFPNETSMKIKAKNGAFFDLTKID